MQRQFLQTKVQCLGLGPLITILNKWALFNFYVTSDGHQDDVTTVTTRDSFRLTIDLPQQLIKIPGKRACLAAQWTGSQKHPAPKPSFPSDSLHDLGQHITVFSFPHLMKPRGSAGIRVYSIKQICKQAFCKYTEIGLNMQNHKWHMTHCLHPAREGAIN